MEKKSRNTFVIIGAGPKGIAVAVKAKVMEEFGFPVDKIVIIEKNEIAANWTGAYGYTNGEMQLGTSPEKDVVFPLETNVGSEYLNDLINQRLLHFSWYSFLVHKKQFSDWIDRGRPAPSHKLWSNYLQWVAEQLGPQITIIKAEVQEIDLSENRDQWKLILNNEKKDIIYSDKLMLTGPGKTRENFIKNPMNKTLPGKYDLESFWKALKENKISPKGRTAVVGSGENAASILLAFAKYAPQLQVDVISPKGFISTRAENFYENQMYGHPEKYGWKKMSIKDRKNFIERTDRGVFSTFAMRALNEQIKHRVIPGRLVELSYDHHLKHIVLNLEYQSEVSVHFYDQVILATGFDHLGILTKILSHQAKQKLENAIGLPLNQKDLSLFIEENLSVKNMRPYLYLPILAGLMQGPGFENLSCLGSLSDKVILSNKNNYKTDHTHFLSETNIFEENFL